MQKDEFANSASGEAVTITTLQQEKEALSQQVKRLVKAEGRLYQYQQELDAQLKEYKELYALIKSLSASFDLDKIYACTTTYVVQNLEYERAVFFHCLEHGKTYRVCAIEGYYDPQERERVAGLTIEHDAPILSPLLEGREYLACKPDSGESELVLYRGKLLMNEYFIYPLGHRSHPHALLAVGNSEQNAQFYRRVDENHGTLLCMGNLVGLISSLIENHFFYDQMEKALEQEKLAEAKYRSIYENAAEGIFRRTPAGRYLDVNPAMARIFGYESVLELLDKVIDIGRQLYVQKERHAEFNRLLEEHGAVAGFETQMFRKDGSIVWVAMNARVVRDSAGAVLYYEGMLEEITERKKSEEALRESEQKYRQLSEALEQRVNETVNELRQKDKLLTIQSRQTVMGEMLNNIAHQWRQPLNMLGLLAQELQMTQKMTGLSEEFVEANVKKTLEIIRRLSKTIDDFRYFFKSDAERVEFKVSEQIEKSVSLLEGSFKAHGIRTEVHRTGDPAICGYPGEFIQVLLNILINARDALVARQVDSPLISITLSSQGTRTVLCIADNAGGIPEEIQDKIFEPYFSTKGPRQGTGIGLFMCKTIIEKNMNGSLSVRNAGEGAEFRIEV
jgi:PAS domain S-box-containing protein